MKFERSLNVIPNQSLIAIDWAGPQTPNTGGFEKAVGLAPPKLGAGGGSAIGDIKFLMGCQSGFYRSSISIPNDTLTINSLT